MAPSCNWQKCDGDRHFIQGEVTCNSRRSSWRITPLPNKDRVSFCLLKIPRGSFVLGSYFGGCLFRRRLQLHFLDTLLTETSRDIAAAASPQPLPNPDQAEIRGEENAPSPPRRGKVPYQPVSVAPFFSVSPPQIARQSARSLEPCLPHQVIL